MSRKVEGQLISGRSRIAFILSPDFCTEFVLVAIVCVANEDVASEQAADAIESPFGS